MNNERTSEPGKRCCFDNDVLETSGNAQRQLTAAIGDILRIYGQDVQITIEKLKDISERVKDINGDLIDWASELTELYKFPEGCRPSAEEFHVDITGVKDFMRVFIECRNKVWRLVTLLMLDYECEFSPMIEELDKLLSVDDLVVHWWPTCFKSFIPRFLGKRLQFQGRDNRCNC